MKPQFSLRMLLLVTAIVAAGFYYYHKKQNQLVSQSGGNGGFSCSSGDYSFHVTYMYRKNGELFLLPLLIVKQSESNRANRRSSPRIYFENEDIRMSAFGHEIPITEGSIVYFDEQLKMYFLRDVKYTAEMIRKFETLPKWLITVVENLSQYHDNL